MLLQLCLLGVLCWWVGNVVYSMLFSPLKDIPGPLLLQVFPYYMRFRLGKGDWNLLVHEYHQAYGPVFRIGWRYVMFVDPAASMDIYSTYKFSKTEEYVAFEYFGVSLFTMRDREQHSRRRRQMALAFTKPSVALMEPTIIQEGLVPLLDNLHQAVGGELDMFHQFHYFSWDVVGKLAFGKSFGMLKGGRNHSAVQWLNDIIFYGFLRNTFSLISWFKISAGESMRKVFQGFALDSQEIVGESFIQLFAGTDTTSNTLTWFFYLVALHPRVEEKLMQELRASGILEGEGVLPTSDYVDKLPYFEATLKESMRLLPAVALTPWRVVPEGGRFIKGFFLPEGTTVGVPLYSMSRSPDVWEDAESFIPERWENTKPAAGSFLPFLVGPRACLGKNLALLELRLVIVNILRRFKLTLVKGQGEMVFFSLPTLKPKSNHLTMRVESR